MSDLVQLYASLTKMRLVASRPVVNAAEHVMENIIERYRAPHIALHDIPLLLQDDQMSFLANFGEASRNELERITGRAR